VARKVKRTSESAGKMFFLSLKFSIFVVCLTLLVHLNNCAEAIFHVI
jgi:hypothetical protein